MHDEDDGPEMYTGISLGDHLLLTTPDGLVAGYLLASSMIGIHLDLTHRQGVSRNKVTDEDLETLHGTLDTLSWLDAVRVSGRGYGVRRPWLKTKGALRRKIAAGALEELEGPERATLNRMLVNVTTVVPMSQVLEVQNFDEWTANNALTGLDFAPDVADVEEDAVVEEAV